MTLVGAVPYRAELTWPRVRDLVAGLDVTILNEGESDRRVKDVIIAAQAVPGILPLLQEGRLVVVPGDRDEVILSACLAAMNGNRLAGLLLTLGAAPDPRVGAVPAGGRDGPAGDADEQGQLRDRDHPARYRPRGPQR